MKILWQSVAPWYGSGYGTQTKNIALLLKELGHDVIIASYYGTYPGAHITWKGIPVYPSDSASWGAKDTAYYAKAFERDAVITLQDIWPFPPKYGLDFNWYPYFPIDHDPIPPIVKDRLYFAVKPIAMSKFGSRQLDKLDIDHYYVPHGVNTEVFKPGDTKYEFLSEDNFVVGCVAVNRGRRKNLTGLLQAFQKFNKLHSDTILYIHTRSKGHNLGDPNLGHFVEELGIKDRVFFPTTRKYDDSFPEESLVHLYNSFDVFALPSRAEGFGVPIIEAQACGVPVIVTNFTSMPELLGGGWLLKDITPEWTYQSSWQADIRIDELVGYLEEAYQEKKSGAILERKALARKKALEYDFNNLKPLWKAIIDDIDQHKGGKPKNLEGIQEWRLMFIPKVCAPRKALDLGCGTTQPYRKVLEQLGEYVGVDNREGPSVTVCDAHNLPFSDGEFGFVWCSEMLEHVENPERVLEEAKRVGKHGAMLFSTPANPYFRMDPEHKAVNLTYTTLSSGDGLIVW